MSVPTTTIRIDEDVKRKAKPILEELGLNISSATNVFLKAVVRCNGLPFDLRLAGLHARGAAVAPRGDTVRRRAHRRGAVPGRPLRPQ